MKHPVATLEGALLDAAVALAERKPWRIHDGHGCLIAFSPGPLCRRDRDFDTLWKPSTEWHDGGPIIERERLWISCADEADGGAWVASFRPHTESSVGDSPPEHPCIFEGPTPLAAAMRAYVASKFGEAVDL